MAVGVTSPLPSQIRATPGEPSSVRIGTVAGASPLTVNVQGTVFTGVGVSGAYTPVVGDVVALLGQSSEASTDPASWLVLGNVESSANSGAHASRWLDGTNVGVVTLASAVSAQTNLAQLALSTDVFAGWAYLIHVQFQYSVTVTTDNWRVRVRRDTALTGAEVGLAQFSGADLQNPLHLVFPYYPAASGAGVPFFFSVERVSGAGTITVSGSPGGGNSRTWSGIEAVGMVSGSGGVWRSTV